MQGWVIANPLASTQAPAADRPGATVLTMPGKQRSRRQPPTQGSAPGSTGGSALKSAYRTVSKLASSAVSGASRAASAGLTPMMTQAGKLAGGDSGAEGSAVSSRNPSSASATTQYSAAPAIYDSEDEDFETESVDGQYASSGTRGQPPSMVLEVTRAHPLFTGSSSAAAPGTASVPHVQYGGYAPAAVAPAARAASHSASTDEDLEVDGSRSPPRGSDPSFMQARTDMPRRS